jgi:GTP-binding protein
MNIRNVAIIAHVDHGKTTLVDALLRQSSTQLNKEQNEQQLIMDSNELERQRGITIFSKNASVIWKDCKINIIDTPGHADFGGEVERVLTMADGALLLIDAKEGPMPQTRFVLKKALERKLKIIVVVNKIDKPDARVNYVLDKTLDLFLELGADDNTADFPIVYSSGKDGKAGLEPDLSLMTDVAPLFDKILKEIPAPKLSGADDSFTPVQMLITSLSYDNFKGRIGVGRVYSGRLVQNSEVAYITREGVVKKFKLSSLMTFKGLERVDAVEVMTGDIAAVAGIPEISIGATVSDPNTPIALPVLAIEEPTVKMIFSVNNSPSAGEEGEFKTSRQISERLYKELETDVALRVADVPDNSSNNSFAGGWLVSGRGELHLAILIERMRREGYEFQVSRPQVITKEVDGKKLVPFERIFIEVPQDFSGIVMQKMGSRRAVLEDMSTDDKEIVYLQFVIPTSQFFGYRSEFIADTKGLGIINTSFFKYDVGSTEPVKRDRGSLVAHESGVTSLYGLVNAQDRGILFVSPGVKVYKGQVIGQNSRGDDMRINVCKTKQLSNMRSKGEGTMEHFNAPKIMELDDALEYVGEDELVEVTPKSIRIRKMILDEVEERRRKSQGLL